MIERRRGKRAFIIEPRVVELGSMVSRDEVAKQLRCPASRREGPGGPACRVAANVRAIRRPKGHTGPAEEMFEAVNAGWMDFGVASAEHVAGTTSAGDVFEAARNAVTA